MKNFCCGCFNNPLKDFLVMYILIVFFCQFILDYDQLGLCCCFFFNIAIFFFKMLVVQAADSNHITYQFEGDGGNRDYRRSANHLERQKVNQEQLTINTIYKIFLHCIFHNFFPINSIYWVSLYKLKFFLKINIFIKYFLRSI